MVAENLHTPPLPAVALSYTGTISAHLKSESANAS